MQSNSGKTKKAQKIQRAQRTNSRFPDAQTFSASSYKNSLPATGQGQDLVILSGMPGSGKSTWGRGFARAHKYSVINADEVRKRIGVADARDQSRNVEIYAALCAEARERLCSGESVIADSTGMLHNMREQLRAAAAIEGRPIAVHLVFFDNVEQAERRNKRRRGEDYCDVAACRVFREALEQSKEELQNGEKYHYRSILFVEETLDEHIKGQLITRDN